MDRTARHARGARVARGARDGHGHGSASPPRRRWLRLLPAVALLAGLLGGLLAGCSDRERTNPLDPDGAYGGSNPWGFSLLAGDGKVTASWFPYSFGDLAGFTISRAGAAAGDSLTIELSPASGSFVDHEVQNGRDYTYRLLPALDDGRIVAPVGPLPATPGPAVCWVADTGIGRVLQLAPDGRAVALAVSDFLSPNAVAVVPGAGRVWVTDSFGGRVVALGRNGALEAEAGGFLRPKALAALADGSVWVADEGTAPGNGALVHVCADGTTDVRIGGLARPAAVAVRDADGAAWVSDALSGTVMLIGAAGDTLLAPVARYVAPLQLATAPGDSTVWLTDDDLRIVAQLASDGIELRRLELAPARPFGIVVDPDAHALWLTIFESPDPDGSLSGKVERRQTDGTLLVRATGFLRPLGIDRDALDSTVWVADTGHDQVVKLAADGDELARLGGMSVPYDVGVDPGESRSSSPPRRFSPSRSRP